MNIKRSKLSRKLVPALILALTALVLLGLALSPIGSGATGLASETQQESQVVTVRAHGSTDEDAPLAGAGEWTQASVEIDSAPDDAVVSAVRVKYHVVSSDPGDLTVQLLSAGTETSYALGSEASFEGGVLTQSTTDIVAFQGAPVNGTWSLAIQGGDPEDYIDDFSIIVYYEMEMPVLRVEGEGAPGKPAFLRLPEGAKPTGLSPDNDEKPDAAPGEESAVVPQDVPPGAIIIETENFEGTFPNSDWYVYDTSNDGYVRGWDDAGCDQCGGDWAAWPADGGADRVDPCTGNNYPNNMETWMIYGPFDLSDANIVDTGAEFVMWHEIEANYDEVFFGVSHDGNNFTGLYWDGSAPCTLHNIYYPDWIGDPSVWVAWMFRSDSSVTYRGPWVDDVVIWKKLGVTPPTVKVEPPEKDVWQGSTFTFDVVVEDAVDLGGFEFELTYNSTCVEAIDATLGPFLGSTGRSVGEVGPAFGTGSVTYGGYSWGGNAGPNGGGVLATVTFRAGLNQCDSALHLQNVSVTDTAGNAQDVTTEDGIVHVVPPQCPTAPDCPEDLNNDGVINVVDIMLVASKWGQSCPTK